jgi:hypothetical protein
MRSLVVLIFKSDDCYCIFILNLERDDQMKSLVVSIVDEAPNILDI